jgi:hypothetical protein
VYSIRQATGLFFLILSFAALSFVYLTNPSSSSSARTTSSYYIRVEREREREREYRSLKIMHAQKHLSPISQTCCLYIVIVLKNENNNIIVRPSNLKGVA